MRQVKYFKTDDGYYKVTRYPTDRIGTINDPENGQIEFPIYKSDTKKISKAEYEMNDCTVWRWE